MYLTFIFLYVNPRYSLSSFMKRAEDVGFVICIVDIRRKIYSCQHRALRLPADFDRGSRLTVLRDANVLATPRHFLPYVTRFPTLIRAGLRFFYV